MMPLSKPSELLSVILFGSHARAEADAFSDKDLCVLVEDVRFQRLLALRPELALALDVPAESLAIYTSTIARQMSDRGSLFLWHLRLEGKIVWDTRNFASSVLDRL